MYTKNKIFEYFNINEKNLFQYISGIIIIKKNNHSIDIINKWYNTCIYELINDNTCNEDPEFIENRHDQSILSVLVNKYGSIKLLDETYFYPNWNTIGIQYPFWAKRIK